MENPYIFVKRKITGTDLYKNYDFPTGHCPSEGWFHFPGFNYGFCATPVELFNGR